MEAQLSPEVTLAQRGATERTARRSAGREAAQAAEEAPKSPRAVLTPGLAFDPKAIPRREWIGGAGWLIPGALNVASGAPGSLKSTLLGHVAAALAAGIHWAGLEPTRAYRVMIAHWEDDTAEMHRRLEAVAGTLLPHAGDEAAPRAREMIAGNLMLVHMAELGPLILQAGIMDPRPTAAFTELQSRAEDHRAEVLILDTLGEAVAVQENDNAILRLALAPLRKLTLGQPEKKRPARAVVGIHHDRKGAEGSALDRMRGGSALGGLIRRHLPVRQMTAEQAREMQIPEEDADGFICLERGKTQYARQRGPAWFRVVSHALPNGDEAAALEPWTPPSFTIGPEHLAAALAAVRKGHGAHPLTTSNKSPACYLAAFEAAGIPRTIARAVLAQMMAQGEVTERAWRDPVSRKPRVRLWADGNDLTGWVS